MNALFVPQITQSGFLEQATVIKFVLRDTQRREKTFVQRARHHARSAKAIAKAAPLVLRKVTSLISSITSAFKHAQKATKPSEACVLSNVRIRDAKSATLRMSARAVILVSIFIKASVLMNALSPKMRILLALKMMIKYRVCSDCLVSPMQP